ncbi:MAG: hypothetical protein ACFE96_18710, partial [Candidatus Hermodarchaeota archaeon]
LKIFFLTLGGVFLFIGIFWTILITGFLAPVGPQPPKNLLYDRIFSIGYIIGAIFIVLFLIIPEKK